jgi:hypothetical protein
MILLGDCLERLKDLEENSVDAVVTDPPYGLAFMNKRWDAKVPSVDVWREVYRVMKPGAHLLSFGGTRTYHRVACAIEDAGFDVRDMLTWNYGSGFPKSLNISKAIDKAAGAEREVIGENPNKRDAHQKGARGFDSALAGEKLEAMRITAPATDAAKQWDGWGTALKPALEPIVLARKPLSESTVAANVLRWGVGGLNIDASRIGYQSPADFESAKGGDTGSANRSMDGWGLGKAIPQSEKISPQGRWPANLLLDEEAAAMLDEQSGQLSQCGGPKKTTHDKGMFGIGTPGAIYREESRGASRFFYVAKASKRERNAGLEGMPDVKMGFSDGANRAIASGANAYETETGGGINRIKETKNFHPTVKPIKLMEYLIKLITPKMAYHCESCYNGLHEKSQGNTHNSAPVQDMRENVSTVRQCETQEILFEGVPASSDEEAISDSMPLLQEIVSAGTGGTAAIDILQQELCDQGLGINQAHGQSIYNSEGLSNVVHAGASDGEQSGNDNGASPNRGQSFGAAAEEVGDSSSHQRKQSRQSNRESGDNVEAKARQIAKTKGKANSMSSLLANDQSVRTCPKCGEALKLGPSIILDPFAGSGSTGVAAFKNGYKFIGIEMSEEYVAIAEKRLQHARAES